jgi:hypothetical protein
MKSLEEFGIRHDQNLSEVGPNLNIKWGHAALSKSPARRSWARS